MSADKCVPTHIRTDVRTLLVRTWNRNSNVDVEIFAQSNTTVGVPIVKMPGVSDNIYPPQKKSFSMMRYVSDHHGRYSSTSTSSGAKEQNIKFEKNI